MSTYSVEIVETPGALKALENDWHALEGAAQNRLPFRTFEWVDSWWRHFAEDKLSVRDRLCTRVVRNAENKVVLAAPMMLTERPSRGPVRVRMLQFFGADPNITEIRGALAAPDTEAEAYRAMLGDLDAQSSTFDWAQWAGVLQASTAETALSDKATARWTRDIPNFILPLSADWETFRKGLKHNIRESLRKCYNSLKRDSLEFTFDVVSAPGAVGPAIDEFYRLHRSRAEVDGTIVHRNVFDADVARHFLTEVSERLAERGMTRVFLLSIGGKVVATRIGYVFGDSIYMYYSGYDPAFGKYSIMTTVVAEAFKWCMEHGLKTANLSTGNDVSKTRWGPNEVVYREGIQLARGLRGKLAYDGWQFAQKAKENERVKGLVKRYLGRRETPSSQKP